MQGSGPGDEGIPAWTTHIPMTKVLARSRSIGLRGAEVRTIIGPPIRGEGIRVDKARLRANARELRTVLTELDLAYRAYSDRIVREMKEQSDASLEVMRQIEEGEQVDWRKPIDYGPTDEERSNIEHASANVLGNLAKQFLALTEELAGDIDQDKTTWKPPPE